MWDRKIKEPVLVALKVEEYLPEEIPTKIVSKTENYVNKSNVVIVDWFTVDYFIEDGNCVGITICFPAFIGNNFSFKVLITYIAGLGYYLYHENQPENNYNFFLSTSVEECANSIVNYVIERMKMTETYVAMKDREYLNRFFKTLNTYVRHR